MGSVIVHHYHFVKELFTSSVSLVKIVNCFNVCWICHWTEYNIALNADGSNDCDVVLLIFCPLNYQWQHWTSWLPYLWSCCPAICWSFIHVNDFSAFHHILEDPLDICNSQLNHCLLTSSAVEAAMDLQISYVEFFIVIGQSVSWHLYSIFLLDEPTSCFKGKMCPFSQCFRIFEDFLNIALMIVNNHRLFYHFSSFLLFRNWWNHSIVFEIFLDDFVNCRPGYASSFCNISNRHSYRSQVSVFPESQFNYLDFHWKLHLRSVPQ